MEFTINSGLNQAREMLNSFVKAAGSYFGNFRISNVIQPVVEVEQWGRVLTLQQTVNLETGHGYFISSSSIPDDEEWQVLMIRQPATTANSDVMIGPRGQTAVPLRVTGATEQYMFYNDFFKNMGFRSGDVLYSGQTSNAGDNARIQRMLYRERKIRAS